MEIKNVKLFKELKSKMKIENGNRNSKSEFKIENRNP